MPDAAPLSVGPPFSDLDGTLIDARAAVTDCCTRVFRQGLGASLPPEGLDAAELFAIRPREVFGLVSADRADDLHALYRRIHPDRAARVTLFPGVAGLLAALAASGRKPGLATSKGRERIQIDPAVTGLEPAGFSALVTAGDAHRRKPDPAPILPGRGRAGPACAPAVYVADGPQDILAAHTAGLPCIAVTPGFHDRADLIRHHPAAMVGDVPEPARVLGLGAAREGT